MATDAMETFNEVLSTACPAGDGRLSRVTMVALEARQYDVGRCLKVASRICEDVYESPEVTRQFWTDYWLTVKKDPFRAGRQSGGKGHEGWKPDFEFLTRPREMAKVYERDLEATEA